MKKTPITIITGALGSGKTTFVNHILTADHGLKIGVIVNEFGDVGIDSDIILASEEDLIELKNGCVCCTARGDLIKASKELLATGKVDYLLVETSGLSEVKPAIVAFDEPELLEKTELDSIICVIDAENYFENLHRSRTALEQLQCADIVLLNKVDLAGSEKVTEVKQDLIKHIPNAQIIETVKGIADLKLLLGVGKFSAEKHAEWGKEDNNEHNHAEAEAIALTTGTVDPEKIQTFFDELPETIFRAKGIVCMKESEPGAKDELKIIFHKVGKRVEMEFGKPWKKDEKRETKIVLIGTDIDKKKLEEKLKNCS
ncbi:hypothetical protein COV18_00895 [Candidatus Woesearchaeota archaeon CG10_big_fil_rev_8_21_14_0_10_37_12]|nr:MAG: hypothetical protein COV18_00895 [Candidatus Woesearchaeota archaeon CG10_big_fil_rev_8_21_14_0_10_37_12]